MLASSSVFWMRCTRLSLLPHALVCACAADRASPGSPARGTKLGADQPVRQQISQPLGVPDVGLAARHVLDMRGIGQRSA